MTEVERLQKALALLQRWTGIENESMTVIGRGIQEILTGDPAHQRVIAAEYLAESMAWSRRNESKPHARREPRPVKPPGV